MHIRGRYFNTSQSKAVMIMITDCLGPDTFQAGSDLPVQSEHKKWWQTGNTTKNKLYNQTLKRWRRVCKWIVRKIRKGNCNIPQVLMCLIFILIATLFPPLKVRWVLFLITLSLCDVLHLYKATYNSSQLKNYHCQLYITLSEQRQGLENWLVCSSPCRFSRFFKLEY